MNIKDVNEYLLKLFIGVIMVLYIYLKGSEEKPFWSTLHIRRWR